MDQAASQLAETTTMFRISILDRSPAGSTLAFDLIDVLQLLGPDALKAAWTLEDVECLGETSDDLHAVSDSGEPISGRRLLELASGVSQTIDGDFYCYRNGLPSRPWVTIRAIDSSAFDVDSEDATVIGRIKGHFGHVVDIPA